MYDSDKQAERRQRGEAFQEEVRRSWKLIPNLWRLRITDGKDRLGTRPADEIVLTDNTNFLIEEKRTSDHSFELSLLRPDQLKGLINFERALSRNRGLVFLSIQDEDVDTAYSFRLIDALVFMKEKGRQYITLEELEKGVAGAVELPRIDIEDKQGYDLKGVLNCK